MVLNHVAKILAVGCASSGIWKEDDVAFRRHPLEFMEEQAAVGDVRTSVNVENERILLRRAEVRRFLHPGLNRFAVETFVGNLLRLGQSQFGKKLFVNVSELFRLRAGRLPI